MTEGKNGFTVGVTVSNEQADQQQLLDAVASRQTVIADGGYPSRENLEQLAAPQIELVVSWKMDDSRDPGALAVHGIAAAFASSKLVTAG